VSETHGKGYFTLGKCFAECNTRQRTLGELYIGKSIFAEYFLSGTRQRLCRVSFGTRQKKVTVTAPSDGDGSFAECPRRHSAKKVYLPSVWWTGTRQRTLQWAPLPVPLPSVLAMALGKEPSSGPLCQYLCRVPWQWHSAKTSLPVPRFSSLPSAIFSTRQRCLYRFPGFLLCQVPWSALGKDGFTGSQVSFFAECHGHSTRQSAPLPSVTLGKVTRMSLFYLLLLFHPNKQKIYMIHITLYINHITE
jgi:hypothetical protein